MSRIDNIATVAVSAPRQLAFAPAPVDGAINSSLMPGQFHSVWIDGAWQVTIKTMGTNSADVLVVTQVELVDGSSADKPKHLLVSFETRNNGQPAMCVCRPVCGAISIAGADLSRDAVFQVMHPNQHKVA
jgi:hypothetical protein